jgi:hypothetical protein
MIPASCNGEYERMHAIRKIVSSQGKLIFPARDFLLFISLGQHDRYAVLTGNYIIAFPMLPLRSSLEKSIIGYTASSGCNQGRPYRDAYAVWEWQVAR